MVEEEPEEEPEEIAPVVKTYGPQDFEEFLQSAAVAKANREKAATILAVQNSDMSASAKSKRLNQINQQYSKDMQALKDEKWRKTRKKTTEKITSKYKIEEINDSYVVLNGEGGQWIYDDHNYLYPLSAAKSDGVSVQQGFEKEEVDHQTILKNEILECDLKIVKEANVAHLMYGDVPLGDFHSSKNYDLKFGMDDSNHVIIQSDKGYQHRLTFSETDILIESFKGEEKKGEDKIHVKEYCKHE